MIAGESRKRKRGVTSTFDAHGGHLTHGAGDGGFSLNSSPLNTHVVSDDDVIGKDSKTIYLSDLLNEAKSNLQMLGDDSKRNGVTYALFGSSGSGKSTIIRKIFIDELYTNSKTDRNLVGKNTKDEYISVLFTESKFADPLKDLKTGVDDIIIDAMGLNQEIYKWMHMMNYRYEKQYRFVVMIDDVIPIKSMSIIYEAFLTYRNMNISSIVSLQYLKLCPLSIRSSLYFCFLLPMNSNEGIEQLVRGYMAMYLTGHTLEDKIETYRLMTKNHHFFLLDNLNHKCYHVDDKYYATELVKRPKHEGAEDMMITDIADENKTF